MAKTKKKAVKAAKSTKTRNTAKTTRTAKAARSRKSTKATSTARTAKSAREAREVKAAKAAKAARSTKAAKERKTATAARAAKHTKTATASQEITIDRRLPPSERRDSQERRSTSVSEPIDENRLGDVRRKVPRRRQIDPTTCERDYSDPEIEFMQAMDDYKRANGRMFPTCSEILEVIQKLGYEKVHSASASTPGTASDPPDASQATDLEDEDQQEFDLE